MSKKLPPSVKFIRTTIIADKVLDEIRLKVESATSFPLVMFLPELVYRASLRLKGEEMWAADYTKQASKSMTTTPLVAELDDRIGDLLSLIPKSKTQGHILEASISQHAVQSPVRIDGITFTSLAVRTITVYAIPFDGGDYFSFVPVEDLVGDSSDEESEED